MAKAQRDKGQRAERELAKLLGGKRVPLSGAQDGYPGDVIAHGMTFEAKVRGNGFKQIYGWLEGVDALAIKADRHEWVICLPVSRYLELVEGREGRFIITPGAQK